VQCLDRVPEIDRAACRQRVVERFSVETMVRAYERVYAAVLETEAGRRA
jgi:glycosyltransferase involved in cell wall biosynthesis